jgi:UDP-N-acetylglucosamine--N-acetylmuramyl-(pentapeptide) pyrophosphoryl-undecaprenol N-acetylglucosamine transferase
MINNKKQKKIFLATGGSGGHIFPAISVAEELSKSNDFDITIVADEIYKKYSSTIKFKNKIINTSKTLRNFKGLKNIVCAFWNAMFFLKSEKPDLIIGFGSYATFPILLACVFKGIPFILHEQNTYIGKVNKIFGRFAKKIMISYPEIYGINYNDMKKVIYTGSPIRSNIRELCKLKYSYPKEDEEFNVLITGGSSGSKIFSQYLPKIFNKEYEKEQKKLKIFHQVREEYVDEVIKYYKDIKLNAVVSSFFNNMNDLLSKSHLVIGRSGSGTVVETSIAGKPIIFIPLMSIKNNKQEDNAKFVEKYGGAIVILEKDFSIKNFQTIFFDLIKDKEKLESMANNIKSIAIIDANEKISNIVKEIFDV